MQVKTQSCVVAGKKTVAVTEQTIDWNNNGTLVQITRGGICGSDLHYYQEGGNDSNLLIVFYVQIMPDD
ncbi:hypothetical protein L2F00_004622, partial [Escherichia coli]|nr:hypothetical protein [Escherichia coli]